MGLTTMSFTSFANGRFFKFSCNAWHCLMPSSDSAGSGMLLSCVEKSAGNGGLGWMGGLILDIVEGLGVPY